MPTLPSAAIAALERGDLIEAIKLTREATGLGLKESKDLVERYGNAQADADVDSASDSAFDDLLQGRPISALPPAALAALRQGRVVEAVKLTRDATGLGLKEAKDLVDAARSGDGSVPGVASAGAQFDPLHEPGRVRGGGANPLLIAVIVLCVLVGAWFVFRG